MKIKVWIFKRNFKQLIENRVNDMFGDYKEDDEVDEDLLLNRAKDRLIRFFNGK